MKNITNEDCVHLLEYIISVLHIISKIVVHTDIGHLALVASL